MCRQANLQPGDLVFLYNPIGRVSIYIGRGMVVSAADTNRPGCARHDIE
jgi:cell wall-associated NlpC family hydrolase